MSRAGTGAGADAAKQDDHHGDEMVVAVAGGGIAGFAFAIAAAKFLAAGDDGKNKVRVIVLERGAENDGDRRTAYSHSLSIRTDVNGVAVLKELGIYDDLKKRSTPTRGFYIGSIGSGPHGKTHVAVSSDWFLQMDRAGLRILRFDLWTRLRDEALAQGIEIRYNSRVDSASEIGGDDTPTKKKRVLLTCSSGATLVADLVVAADGHRSRVRESPCPEEQLHCLDTCVVSAPLKVDSSLLPEFCVNHHGLSCGPDGTALFMSDEGDNELLFALSFRYHETQERSAIATNEALRERVRRAANIYPAPFSALISRLLDVDKEQSYALSCFDKLPNPPVLGKVIFIGDACHPVSPFAGAGACMALVDGFKLAKTLFSLTSPTNLISHGFSDTNLADALQSFYAEVLKTNTDVVLRQRRTIDLAHTTSFAMLALRSTLFTALPYLAHKQKRQKAIKVVSTTALAAGIAGLAMWYRSRH